MMKYSLMFFVLLLSIIIFNPIISESTPLIEPVPVIKQLVIDAPAEAKAGDNITIKVTLKVDDTKSSSVDGAYLTFDFSWIGQTDKEGVLNYTIPRTMNGTYKITARVFLLSETAKTINVSEYLDKHLEIQCPSNESLIRHNFIIVVDASQSTSGRDPTTGISFIDRIDANALDIIQNVGQNSRVGIVTFGNIEAKTDILPMNSENNKVSLEKFIKSINLTKVEPTTKYPTDLDNGLLLAEELLNSIHGTKEIIAITDGKINDRESFDRIKNKTIDLKNKSIKIHFIQVLSTSLAESSKTLERFSHHPSYEELSELSSDEEMIMLNPEEKVSSYLQSILSNEVPFDEQCSLRANEPLTIHVTTSNGYQIEDSNVSLDGIDVGNTNQTGKISFTILTAGLHNITANKLGYEKAIKNISVLSAPRITLNYTVITNQTSNSEVLILPLNQSKEAQDKIKEIPGFEGLFTALIMFSIKVQIRRMRSGL